MPTAFDCSGVLSPNESTLVNTSWFSTLPIMLVPVDSPTFKAVEPFTILTSFVIVSKVETVSISVSAASPTLKL